ncbi:kinase-like protein [Rozella allomycis CSF55]|uniref:non-specific serine/threonine protein kinase n=1 Tax=Rozella allomycis (strain CSF55) TaxID=988480 RepID=A0A4P9YLL3_ROZAC|nr:kinase-like protein [Rozella allomycis CSF55]
MSLSVNRISEKKNEFLNCAPLNLPNKNLAPITPLDDAMDSFKIVVNDEEFSVDHDSSSSEHLQIYFFIETTIKGTITACSGSFYEFTGLVKNEVQGKNLEDFIDQDEKSFLNAADLRIEIAFHIRNSNGLFSEVNLQSSKVEIRNNSLDKQTEGSFIYWIGICTQKDLKKPESDDNTILCRICEMKHSNYCTELHSVQNEIQKMNDLITAIKQEIQAQVENWKDDDSLKHKLQICHEVINVADQALLWSVEPTFSQSTMGSAAVSFESIASSKSLLIRNDGHLLSLVPTINIEEDTAESPLGQSDLAGWKMPGNSEDLGEEIYLLGLELEALLEDKLKLLNVAKLSMKELSRVTYTLPKLQAMESLNTRDTPNESNLLPVTQPLPPSIKDFEIVKPISRGAYGKVYLAKKKVTGEYFAIKVIRKHDVLSKNQFASLQSEQLILTQLDSPYVVKMYYSFQTKNNLYFVLEYLNGGDCASLIKAIGRLPDDWARKYTAQIVLGLESLHKNDIIHRDLKPENLLIDSLGHIRLSDFGLSKMSNWQVDSLKYVEEESLDSSDSRLQIQPELRGADSIMEMDKRLNMTSRRLSEISILNRSGVFKSRSNSFVSSSNSSRSSSSSAKESSASQTDRAVGTPDYMAVEVLNGEEHSKALDWWSMGVILYEFIYGIPPFHGNTTKQIFENIKNGKIEFPEDEDVSQDAIDLISRLLDPNPKSRLGGNGVEEVKRHPYFQEIDWQHLYDEEGVFQPHVENDTDTTYFDDRGANNLDEVQVDIGNSPDADVSEESWMPAFTYKNLNLLGKANNEAIKELRKFSQPKLSLSTTFEAFKSPRASREFTTIETKSFLSRLKRFECLVVDSNPISVRILETLLGRLNCTCLNAIDGIDALRILLDKKFDIVFINIELPRLNGDQVARLIKSTRNINREVPILATTAYGVASDVEYFDSFLMKPLTKEKIEDELSRFLD